jgi:hypothetical protein
MIAKALSNKKKQKLEEQIEKITQVIFFFFF